MRQFEMSATTKCSERIRVGVIGCGPITLNAHVDAIAKAANIELQAIADRDEVLLTEVKNRLRPARAYPDADDLLNDPKVQLVVIAVHDRLHVPLVRKALGAGKHVLVEKPLGISVEECESLRHSVTRDTVLAVGCNRRFLPGVRATKKFLREEGGEVISYRSHYYDSTFRHSVTQVNKFPPAVAPGAHVVRPEGPDWKLTDKRLYDIVTHSPHLLDLARYLVGPISAVRAAYREVSVHADGSPALARGHAWWIELRFLNGSNGQCLLLLPRAGEFEEGFEVHCSGGHVTCSYPYVWFQRENTRIYSASAKEFRSPDAQDCHTFRLQLEALARSILTGSPQANAGLEDGIACVKAMAAASYSSLHGGEWVEVESVAGDVGSPYVIGRELAAVG
ncbi:MAG: Gfo/Idh/MocA family oxidoreductase [Acidobacteriaceae bacterium]|nr:Gfo/Idh/MocA family oxidoreductase [Acidobacteriaceae bacterium]